MSEQFDRDRISRLPGSPEHESPEMRSRRAAGVASQILKLETSLSKRPGALYSKKIVSDTAKRYIGWFPTMIEDMLLEQRPEDWQTNEPNKWIGLAHALLDRKSD